MLNKPASTELKKAIASLEQAMRCTDNSSKAYKTMYDAHARLKQIAVAD